MGNDCKIIIISGINWQNKKGGLNVQYNNYSIVKTTTDIRILSNYHIPSSFIVYGKGSLGM